MKRQIQIAVVLLLFTVNAGLSVVHAQGSLTPSSAPTPGMKTLSQIEPRTPISSLPYAISYPGAYYVTTNLTGSLGSHGIYITSGNVTLDLGGYTLQGVSGANSAIYVSGACTNITVFNGNITGWSGNGVDIEGSSSLRNIAVKKVNASANNGIGIYVGNTTASVVAGQIIECNCISNYAGFYANDCLVENCRSENNAYYGYYLTRSQLLNSSANYNANAGIWLTSVGNVVRGSQISFNGGQGIYLDPSSGGDVIADNLIVSNSSVGIQVSGSGSFIARNNLILNQSSAILIYGNNNRIDNNNIQSSGSFWGIGVNSSALTNNVVIRNTVFGSTANYYNPGNNDFGPIGAASTNASPWGNISH